MNIRFNCIPCIPKNEISLDVNANKTKNKKVPRNILVSINTQSELTAELLGPKLLGALLNSVNSTLNSKKEGSLL